MGFFDFSRPQGAAAGKNVDSFAALDDEILRHNEHDSNQGVLTHLLARVWDGGSSQSMDRMQALKSQESAAQKAGDSQALARLKEEARQYVKDDQSDLADSDRKLGYATGAMKSVGLFLGNKWGVAATLGVYGLDNAKAGDSLSGQLCDGVLGMGKGLALRKTFEFAGNKNWGPIEQGVSIGFLSRFSDLALSRNTYKNGFFNGLSDAAVQSADPRSLAIDAGTFVAARGLFGGANLLSRGRIAANPMFNTMAVGASFGATTGATNEIARQKSSGEKFDLGKVLTSSLIQGSIDSLAAAPGGAVNLRTARLGGTIDSGDRIDTTRVASESPTARAREFSVTSGQEALNSFMSGERSSQGAMLKVRELMQGRPGDERSLFVRHLAGANSGSTSIPADNVGADRLVAFCNPDGVELPSNHVLPEATGAIRLSATQSGDRIAFTTGDTTMPGYGRSIELGNQNGEKLQHELFTWTQMENGRPLPGMDPDLVEARDLREQLQNLLKTGEWQLIETGKRSAADQVGMDYLLVNKKDGRWMFFDTTLDPASKKDVSALRQPGIVIIRSEEGSPSMQSKIDFMSNVLNATRISSPFNMKDIQPPSPDAAKTEAQQAEDIARYRKQIASKIANLRREATSHSDETERWFSDQQANDFVQYDEDVARAQKFVKSAAGEIADPEYPRHFATYKVQIRQLARDVIGPMMAKGTFVPEYGNGSTKTRVEYDAKYDELSVWANGQRFMMEGASKIVADAIETAANKRNWRDYGDKRRYIAGETTTKVLRAVADRLSRMWSGAIIGEPGLKDPPPKGSGGKR